MKKENENIHLHNIKSQYETLKKPSEQFEVLGKAELPEELKANQRVVLKELEAMHDFAAVIDSRCSQTEQETLDKQQITDESLSDLNVTELLSFLQNMKAEEQELLDRKQLLLGNLDKTKLILIGEINKKRNSIEDLKLEVLEIENTCKEIAQALELSVSLT
jgi:hypothetical protein